MPGSVRQRSNSRPRWPNTARTSPSAGDYKPLITCRCRMPWWGWKSRRSATCGPSGTRPRTAAARAWRRNVAAVPGRWAGRRRRVDAGHRGSGGPAERQRLPNPRRLARLHLRHNHARVGHSACGRADAGFRPDPRPAPTTEIAVEVVRELQKRSILTFLCANRDGRTAREQIIEGGVLKDDAPLKECWDQYVVPVGPDSLDSIYVLNWSIRSALTFGGHKRGESRKCLD